MKKFLLLFIPAILLAGIKVKAEEIDYYISFEEKECRVPIGGNVIDYLPKAYVYSKSDNEIISSKVTYAYGKYGNTLSDINNMKVGENGLFVEAVSNEYGISALKFFSVHVYDDVSPTITTNSIIEKRYNEEFDISELYNATDNSKDTLEFSYSGEFDSKKVGEYDLTINAIDKGNNEGTKDIKLIIYDDIKPIINAPDELEIEYETNANLEKYISAYDEYDGKLEFSATEINLNELGKSECTITAVDSSYNEVTKNIIINVVDTTSPVIKLKNTELYENENYDLRNNILSVYDNYDTLDISKINIVKKLVGTGKYLVTYIINDTHYNQGVSTCLINYTYNNYPTIEAVNLDDLKDSFDPLYYVKAYDKEDGDITNKIMVIEVNYDLKYGIYEVFDSNGNTTRVRINYVSEDKLNEYENVGNNTVVFPSEEIIEEPSEIENNKEMQNVKKEKDYTIIYYIIAGCILIIFSGVILFKHFKKKMV